jgi:hypothetical protein
MAIEFNINPILKELDTLQKVKLPRASRRSLYETGRYLRDFHRREMQSTFRDPVPFILRSPRYRVDPNRLELTLAISDDGTLGQTPADYLSPFFVKQAAAGAPSSPPALPSRSPVQAI